jgi:glycosyltransferase involved in cell wall biosynthesis
MKVLFLYLKTFSGMGGIEKFNRVFMKVFQDLINEDQIYFNAITPYDTFADERYLEENHLIQSKGRLRFIFQSIWESRKYDILILSHINLWTVGLLLRILYPKKKIVLITHGIEIWKDLSFLPKYFLNTCDLIISVSQFTRNQIIEKHKTNPDIIKVLNNTIDPYHKLPQTFVKPENLLHRYKLKIEQPILITVARLNTSEKYKGYDLVLNLLPEILKSFPNLVYLICGKYDQPEYTRLSTLIHQLGINSNVILAGYIREREMVAHYLLGDVFVMPSRKEGFGIVFIESMACGLQAIGGNLDGTVDAFQHGGVGFTVDPTQPMELKNAILTALQNPLTPIERKKLQKQVIDKYGFSQYKNSISQLMKSLYLAKKNL